MAYTSDRRLYLTKDGGGVEEGDERAATLLIGEGGTLSDEDAATYGLTGTKASKKTPENKAVTSPASTKAAG